MALATVAIPRHRGPDTEAAARIQRLGRFHVGSVSVVAAYGRPFTRALDAGHLHDAARHMGLHVALVCDAADPAGPVALIEWPFQDARVGKERARDHVARELKSGALALIMPMMSEGEEHGRTD